MMFLVFNKNGMYYSIFICWLFFTLHLKYAVYKNDPYQLECKFSKGSRYARTSN